MGQALSYLYSDSLDTSSHVSNVRLVHDPNQKLYPWFTINPTLIDQLMNAIPHHTTSDTFPGSFAVPPGSIHLTNNNNNNSFSSSPPKGHHTGSSSLLVLVKKCSINLLPDDVMIDLLDILVRDEYLNLAYSCKLWYRLATQNPRILRALYRWHGCLPTTLPLPKTPLSWSPKGHYTGLVLDRGSVVTSPHALSLNFPTTNNLVGTIEWPQFTRTNVHIRNLVSVPWLDTDRCAVHSRKLRRYKLTALTWTTTDNVHIGFRHREHNCVYNAVVVGPWLLGIFEPEDPSDYQRYRGLFVMLVNESIATTRTDAPANPFFGPLTYPMKTSTPDQTLFTFRGILSNTHAPFGLPNIYISLRYHDPPLKSIPFQISSRLDPAKYGPIRWTGSIVITSGMGDAVHPSGGKPMLLSRSGFFERDGQWTDGLYIEVAGCIATHNHATLVSDDHSLVLPHVRKDDWLLFANYKQWLKDHDASRKLRRQLGLDTNPYMDHVSEWTRTYAPLTDVVLVRPLGSDRIAGWWHYPTVSCFFAERDGRGESDLRPPVRATSPPLDIPDPGPHQMWTTHLMNNLGWHPAADGNFILP